MNLFDDICSAVLVAVVLAAFTALGVLGGMQYVQLRAHQFIAPGALGCEVQTGAGCR